MNKFQTRLLALLLICALMLTGTACASSDVQEPTEGKTTIRIPEPANYDKCTELGTPLADVRVRRALAYAIDMDTVIEALYYGNAEKAAGFGLDAGVEGYEYDPEKAKELLAEAGWPSDYVLDVVYYHEDQQTVDFLNVIGSYWDAVGVKAQFRKIEGDLAAQLWTAPSDLEGDSAVKWDLAYGAVAALTESEVYGRFASDATNNSHTPPIEGLDELIEQAASTLDEQERKTLYEEVQKLLGENVSCIPLLHQNCFIYTSDHIDTGDLVHGNDQFSYDKDILNWTTDREDNTLYTDGGPETFFCYPVVNPGLYLYQELVFERLIGADSELNPTDGQIAESYTVSEDGKTVEFIIREDILWHDEEPLTAEDVKFTFELYMKCPGANSVLTGVLNELKGAQVFLDGDAEKCTGIIVEGNKVTFQFAEVTADALKVFSQWPILPKHKLENVKPEKLQQDKFWKNPIGSGPYKVAEVELGAFCTLERWEGYRNTGDGNIEYIHMASSGETNGDLGVLAASGMIDYAWGKSTDDASYIESLEGMYISEIEIPYTRCFFINQYPHESYIAQQNAAEETTIPTE